ncbi:MAG TPA: ADP-glyceromanno-heptose 6-epimerase [Candidatus Baltobacteraceae bacterium]|nr:ADP-glyceromanno-heptose 6-epimerase [Candidatus Baltobacteraceae bacterium]
MNDSFQRPIVVTGAAGLIGSALVWALNRRGIENIIAVDRLDDSEKWRHLVPLRFLDYVDAEDFAECIAEQPDYYGQVGTVFHLGACSSTTETDADYLVRNNYEYTKALAQWALDSEARFVYASSAATYGGLEDGLSDEADLRTLRPLNMYAYSKQLFDLYAQHSGMSAKIVGLKYFNVFGPNEDHKGEMRSIVHKAYEQIRASGSVKLFKSYRPEFADGEQRRDFIYVKDAVEMTIHVAASSLTGLVNIGSGRAQTWLELVRPIFAALGVPERITFIEMPEQLRAKYQYSTQAIIERLRSSGYAAPLTPLAEAVQDYVTNYLVPARVLDPAQQEALSIR